MKTYMFENAHALATVGTRESPTGGGVKRDETYDASLLGRLAALGDELEPELVVLRQQDPILYDRCIRALQRVYGSMGIAEMHARICRTALPTEAKRRLEGGEEEVIERQAREETPGEQLRETAYRPPDELDAVTSDGAESSPHTTAQDIPPKNHPRIPR